MLFSPSGLATLVERLGLRVVRLRTEGLNPSELRHRAPECVGGEPDARAGGAVGTPAHRNASAAALNAALSGSPWRRAVKGAINGVLSFTRTGDRIKIDAVRE